METKLKQRLTLGTEPSFYSTMPPLFDLCGKNDLMSLSFTQTQPFLDWLGWEKSNTWKLMRYYLQFVRANRSGGSGSAGWLSDPCADPNTYEWEDTQLTIEGFARLRRQGPVRDITRSGMNYCEASPRYRLDGTQINDDREWDMRAATEVILQDLSSMLVSGNNDTAGQFDGLATITATAQNSSLLNSINIDWKNHTLAGGAGATWNSVANIPTAATLIDTITAVFRRIRERIRMAPTLATQQLRVGDVILLLPGVFLPCILDAYTCWAVCDNDYNAMNTFEARRFRDNLNGGMFGAGRIFIEGFEIPLMPWDWGLIGAGGAKFDMYMLVGAVGSYKTLFGQYNDMDAVVAKKDPGEPYWSTDGGRLLGWYENDHTCEKRIVEMQPRLVSLAPWTIARFKDIVCNIVGPALSGDPWSAYFPYP
jgi:hypothetical protein